MSRFAVVVLLNADGDRTNEATVEAATFEEALDRCRAVEAGYRGWRAITILHIEDLPVLMQDAERAGEV